MHTLLSYASTLHTYTRTCKRGGAHVAEEPDPPVSHSNGQLHLSAAPDAPFALKPERHVQVVELERAREPDGQAEQASVAPVPLMKKLFVHAQPELPVGLKPAEPAGHATQTEAPAAAA